MASKEYIGVARLTEVFGYILAKLLTVKNQSGTALTKRFVMKFKDISVSDNSTSGETEVEAFHAISSESELTNAGDGAYIGTYDDDVEDILDASMIAYGNGTVEDALDGIGSEEILIAKGQIFDDNVNSNTVGYGRATVHLSGGLARIEFEGKLDSVSNSQSGWVRLNPTLLSALNSDIPAITPLEGVFSNCMILRGGSYSTDLNGYGAAIWAYGTPIDGWGIGRMYTSSGSMGLWAPAAFSTDQFFIGECYGTYE